MNCQDILKKNLFLFSSIISLKKKEKKMENNYLYSFWGRVILALGITLGGFFPGYFYYQSKLNANTVSVKGLAELDVKADLAIWDIKFNTTNNNLTVAGQQMTKQLSLINSYLKERGFTDGEITVGRVETNDLMTNPYRNQNISSRYILSQTVTVHSTNVDQVEEALRQVGVLVEKGVVFDGQSYGSPVSYLFTGLNTVKPKMLEEATQNAKKAADEFAKSSGTRVGKIKQASQGVFSILPREQTPGAMESAQINKKVRVVSTITYWLE